MTQEKVFDWTVLKKANVKVDEEAELKLDQIAQQVNVDNGLTPNSTFGPDLIVRTIQSSYLGGKEPAEVVASIQARMLGDKPLMTDGKQTPIEQIHNKRRGR
jgi:hypothetical protein